MYSGTESGLPDKSWLELAEDTDRLAGEGRREQAKRVIAEAWAEMFPETPVHINTVVQWLQAMQWMCSDVVGSMVVLQESNVALERRVGWMRKTVKNPLWKQKAKLTSATQTSEPMDDLENIEATYQFLIGKYGQAEADVWHAEQLARIGA